MKTTYLKKSLVIGIIILFVGASFLPTIGGNKNFDKKNLENEKYYKSEPNSLFFTENVGQFPEEVRYQIKTSEANVYLCNNEIVTVFSRPGEKESEIEVQSIVTSFLGSKSNPDVQGIGILPNINNYYLGNNPNNWFTGVKNYNKVIYKNLYDGIDLVYYSYKNTLKYDFIVNPGADISSIKIKYDGINDLFITSSDDIQIDINFGTIYEKKPFIYQKIDGIQKEIKGKYNIIEKETFVFELNKDYNPNCPLIIDPTLVYSTYLGGSNYDIAKEIDVDSNGYAYVVGGTDSNNFPTQNPYQGTYFGLTDAFVTKLTPGGNGLVYSTYFGGTSHDYGESIDVDGNGNAGIVGTTYSSDFPTHHALYPNLHGIQDAFVARFNTNGALIYCTYLGGSNWEWGLDIKVERTGVAYVIGWTDSSDFPLYQAYDSSWNGNFDFFISKLDPPGGFLMFSTYLGGSNADIGYGIDFDSNGNAYVTGYSWSSNFPVSTNAYDSSYNGNSDIVVAILDTVTGGSGALSYGSYIYGQGDDFGYDIVIDSNNILYLTGETGSTISQFFPVTSSGYQQFLNGSRDAFILQLDTSLPSASQNLYCSYLGGMTGGIGADKGDSIDLVGDNLPYISGATECSDFPLVNALGSYNGNNEAFASLFDTTASGPSSLIDSTYIGGSNNDEGYGIAVDSNNDAYIAGLTDSNDFPIQTPYQSTHNGLGDAFVTKITPTGLNNAPNQPTIPSGPTSGKVGKTYTYSTSATDPDGDKIRYGWDWDGDGAVDQWDDNGGTYYFSGATISTSHSWSAKGTYQISVIAEDTYGSQSIWSNSLTVTITKNKARENHNLMILLEYIFNRYPILKQILGF